MQGARKSGLTLAPEVARDDMREQIRKKIKNDDLYEGCREAFKNGWQRVKLYFLCGLPGERQVDLDGIVDMAEHISAIGKEVKRRYVEVTASVSNFVPKPHTPYQWNGMQTREYLRWAGQYLKKRCKLKAAKVKQHDVECSLLEGILTRGDRRVAPALEEAWRRGIFCELGTGDVDLDGFLETLCASGYDGWICVEQDRIPREDEPLAEAAEAQVRNREWLRAHGL